MNTTIPIPDPFLQTPWKQGVLITGLTLWLLSSIAVTTILVNRSWKPFKSKQIGTIVSIWIATLIYFISCCQIYEIVDQTSIFSYCIIWFMMSQTMFGCGLILTILSYRMRRLYFIMVLVKPAHGLYFHLPLILTHFPCVLLTLMDAAFPNVFFTSYAVIQSSGILGCTYINLIFLYALYLAILQQIFYLLYLAYRVSKVRQSFNEYKSNMLTTFISTSFIVINFIFFFTGFNATVAGKTFLTLGGLCWGISCYILPIYGAVWGFYFSPDMYLLRFHKGMRDGAEVDLGLVISQITKSGTATVEGN